MISTYRRIVFKVLMNILTGISEPTPPTHPAETRPMRSRTFNALNRTRILKIGMKIGTTQAGGTAAQHVVSTIMPVLRSDRWDGR